MKKTFSLKCNCQTIQQKILPDLREGFKTLYFICQIEFLQQENCHNRGNYQADNSRFHIPADQLKGADAADCRCRDNRPWDQGAATYPDRCYLPQSGEGCLYTVCKSGLDGTAKWILKQVHSNCS
jgi:hypothetical protein